LLGHAPILIVEDEPLLAFELQIGVEDAGGEVVGPVGTADAALQLLNSVIIAGAVLDVQLADGDVTPVAEALMARRIPMVVQSEFDLPLGLQHLCPDVPFYKKPASPRLLLAKLAQLIRPADWA
jgi:DNA-binding response OmpR family regulator